MIVSEIHTKSILSRSKVMDYVVNPYVGCQHGCGYCYARFMKRFTGHKEAWGEFVDIKVNAVQILAHQIEKMTPGKVWISGVCDPYQPLEKKYRLTRQCLEILIENSWSVTVQTKSPLVLRDLSIMKDAREIEVGFSIATGDEEIRRLFEPNAPAIEDRISALEQLHRAGIKTFVMIAPMLPGVEQLTHLLDGKVDYVLIDRMNYHYGDWVYRKNKLEIYQNDVFFSSKAKELACEFGKKGVESEIIFL